MSAQRERLLRVFPLLMMMGCAAPFVEARPSSPREGVTVTWCGASATSPASVMRSLEPPSAVADELHGGRIEPPKELRVCLKVANRASRPVRIDRANVQLKCPRERRDWVQDTDDRELQIAPGQSRELYVGFTYTPLDPGEEVEVVLDRALTLGGKSLRVDPLVLRHK